MRPIVLHISNACPGGPAIQNPCPKVLTQGCIQTKACRVVKRWLFGDDGDGWRVNSVGWDVHRSLLYGMEPRRAKEKGPLELVTQGFLSLYH